MKRKSKIQIFKEFTDGSFFVIKNSFRFYYIFKLINFIIEYISQFWMLFLEKC